MFVPTILPSAGKLDILVKYKYIFKFYYINKYEHLGGLTNFLKDLQYK